MTHRSRSDVAQRWASILVGVAALVVVTWMTAEAMGPPHNVKKDLEAAAPKSSAPSAFAAAPLPAVDAGVADDLDASLTLTGLSLGDAALLPSSAPRQVKIGVVLVAFAGAEAAGNTTRSKRDALTIAQRLVPDARSDFHHAVTEGDSGSSDDIGRIPRGVLDPQTESTVFALGSGEVSDVLETPRGYWIVKRLD